MICHLALTTGTLPSQWAQEDPADIATVLLLMQRDQRLQQEQIQQAQRRR